MTHDSSSSEGCASWFKWLIGIVVAVLAAGSGIVALLNYLNPRQPPATAIPRPTATAVVCFISGTIFNSDDNQPLSNVQVSYLRITQDNNEDTHRARSKLTTTDIHGHFEADCSSVERENFPLRLRLSRQGWCSEYYVTNEYVDLGKARTAINLFVSDKQNRTALCP